MSHVLDPRSAIPRPLGDASSLRRVCCMPKLAMRRSVPAGAPATPAAPQGAAQAPQAAPRAHRPPARGTNAAHLGHPARRDGKP